MLRRTLQENLPQFVEVAVGVRLPVDEAILGGGIRLRRIDSLPSQECAFIEVFEGVNVTLDIDVSEDDHFE